MQQLNINEVKTQLSGILSQVEKGETVVICKRNKPIAEIKPIRQQPKKRPLGLMKKNIPTSKCLMISTNRFRTKSWHISQEKDEAIQAYPVKTLW